MDFMVVCNVKELIVSDEPTENYYRLQFPLALSCCFGVITIMVLVLRPAAVMS